MFHNFRSESANFGCKVQDCVITSGHWALIPPPWGLFLTVWAKHAQEWLAGVYFVACFLVAPPGSWHCVANRQPSGYGEYGFAILEGLNYLSEGSGKLQG